MHFMAHSSDTATLKSTVSYWLTLEVIKDSCLMAVRQWLSTVWTLISQNSVGFYTALTEELPTPSMLLRLASYSLTDDTPKSIRRLYYKLVVMAPSDLKLDSHFIMKTLNVLIMIIIDEIVDIPYLISLRGCTCEAMPRLLLLLVKGEVFSSKDIDVQC